MRMKKIKKVTMKAFGAAMLALATFMAVGWFTGIDAHAVPEGSVSGKCHFAIFTDGHGIDSTDNKVCNLDGIAAGNTITYQVTTDPGCRGLNVAFSKYNDSSHIVIVPYSKSLVSTDNDTYVYEVSFTMPEQSISFHFDGANNINYTGTGVVYEGCNGIPLYPYVIHSMRISFCVKPLNENETITSVTAVDDLGAPVEIIDCGNNNYEIECNRDITIKAVAGTPRSENKTNTVVKQEEEEQPAEVPFDPVIVANDKTGFTSEVSSVVPGDTYNFSRCILADEAVKGINKIVEKKPTEKNISIFSDKPITFNREFIENISQKNLTLTYYFMHKGHYYSITVNGNANANQILGKAKYEGPLYVGKVLGTTRLIK